MSESFIPLQNILNILLSKTNVCRHSQEKDLITKHTSKPLTYMHSVLHIHYLLLKSAIQENPNSITYMWKHPFFSIQELTDLTSKNLNDLKFVFNNILTAQVFL